MRSGWGAPPFPPRHVNFRIFRNFRYRIGRFSQSFREYFPTAIGPRKRVSASFRRCAPSSAGPVFPAESRFPTFPPFPPLLGRPWTSRRQSVRTLPAAATDRGAPVEESMLMNIMPILCRRRSAGISHNIAQERQVQDGHHPCLIILAYRQRECRCGRQHCKHRLQSAPVPVTLRKYEPLRAQRNAGTARFTAHAFSIPRVIEVQRSDRLIRADEFSKTPEAERNRIPNCRHECSRLRAGRP